MPSKERMRKSKEKLVISTIHNSAKKSTSRLSKENTARLVRSVKQMTLILHSSSMFSELRLRLPISILKDRMKKKSTLL